MLHRESADEARIDEVILQSLRHILEHQDALRFLEWARDTIPLTLELDAEGLTHGEDRRLAILLARAIWNATPLPRLGFRSQPLAEPDPDAPCACGSGRLHAACCGRIAERPELPPDLIWELMIHELRARQLQQALAERAVPDHLLGFAAERWLAEDRPGRAVALLEPLFGDKPTPQVIDGRFEQALNVLCDAYDRLDHWKKKREFLERMTRHDSRPLRASAWQRLSTIHIDEGDFLHARVAFTQAQREGPDSPGTALLEITLLAAQRDNALARNRAVFWHRKLQRAGTQSEDILTFLRHAAEDPQGALMASQSAIIDPLLVILREWAGTAAERRLPAHVLQACGADDGAEPRAPLDEHDAAGEPVPGPAAVRVARIVAPRALHRLESEWRRAFDTPKPTSTRLVPLPVGDIWEREAWVGFLAGHPETADSLEVLDDLATALYIHPESTLPWVSHALLRPVLERAEKILRQALSNCESCIVPWRFGENRPALRLLFRLYLLQTENDDEEQAAETLRTLLRLNPSDNHGVRGELMNHYLRRNENGKALELAGRFPDDLLADLAYGEVLALYRHGERSQAERALERALSRLPRIPHYLTRKRVRQPDLDSAGITPGGDDQAWLYREAMRDVWVAEPGILAWLKKKSAWRGKISELGARPACAERASPGRSVS